MTAGMEEVRSGNSGQSVKRWAVRLKARLRPLFNIQGDKKYIAVSRGISGIFIRFIGTIATNSNIVFGYTQTGTAVTLLGGPVNLYGRGQYTCAVKNDVTLTAEDEYLYVQWTKSNPADVAWVQAPTAPNVADTSIARVLFYHWEKTGGVYGDPTIHHRGAIDFETPA